MKYKVTALQDVRFLAHVRGTTPDNIGGIVLHRPTESLQWLSLKAGHSRKDLGRVEGVDPSFVPDEEAISVRGVRSVHLKYDEASLPQEFFDLLRVELQDDSTPRKDRAV
jgi:hypothetical protein